MNVDDIDFDDYDGEPWEDERLLRVLYEATDSQYEMARLLDTNQWRISTQMAEFGIETGHPKPDETTEERLAQRIDGYPDGDDDECWNWTGCSTDHGYGVMSVDGEWGYVHRHMLERSGVDTSDAEYIIHECGEASCVNPAHLRPASKEEWADHCVAARGHTRRNGGETA